MTEDLKARIAAALDAGDREVVAQATAMGGAGRGNGIVSKEEWTKTRFNNDCPSGIEEQYCVKIVFENGDILDRCGPWRCQ